MQLLNERVLSGALTVAPVNTLVVPPMLETVHVLAMKFVAVVAHTEEVPDLRLAEIATAEFFATPPTSSVVAEAAGAANAVRAIAADAARPSIFNFMILLAPSAMPGKF